jgi:hypothetical protein
MKWSAMWATRCCSWPIDGACNEGPDRCAPQPTVDALTGNDEDTELRVGPALAFDGRAEAAGSGAVALGTGSGLHPATAKHHPHLALRLRDCRSATRLGSTNRLWEDASFANAMQASEETGTARLLLVRCERLRGEDRHARCARGSGRLTGSVSRHAQQRVDERLRDVMARRDAANQRRDSHADQPVPARRLASSRPVVRDA